MATLRSILVNDPMQFILPVIIFLVTLLAGWIVRRVVMRALRAWVDHTHSRAGAILIGAIRGPIFVLTVIIGVRLAVEAATLPGRYMLWIDKGLMVLVVVSLTLMSMKIAGGVVRDYGAQVPGALPVTTLTQSLAQLTVVLLGIVVLLRGLGLEIAPILTALGVGGLAVALALQDTLSNLFAGFYVAVAGQIRLGDYIKLNTGEEGYVTDIGWRSTTIRALANNMIIIPNAKLAQAIVTNFYLPEKRLGTGLQVSVRFESDIDHVQQVLLEIALAAAKEVPGMLGDPAPNVQFDPGFGDWNLGFTVGFQVAEFANQGGVKHELRKRIWKRFREEGIELPYPVREVHLEGGRPVEPTR